MTVPVPIRPVVAAMPDLVIAAAYVTAWISPSTLGNLAIVWLIFALGTEFAVIHCATFLGAVVLSDAPRRRKWIILGSTASAYTVLAVVAAAWTGEPSLLVGFWGLMAGKFVPLVLLPPDLRTRAALRMRWSVAYMVYFFLLLLTLAMAPPRLGMADPVVHSYITGLWLDEPWRPMALGSVYFTAMAVVEVVVQVRPPAMIPD